MKDFFYFDDRLGIMLPVLDFELDHLHRDTQHSILFQWEQIRGSIPDRIADLEQNINQKQALLQEESNFLVSCHLNEEIAELASVINDLWIWYRTNESAAVDKILQ